MPPELNYAVLTGTLLGDPREGRGPAGDPVFLVPIEFPVAHPEHPRLLWNHASYDIEVPGDVGGSDLEELRRGSSVLVAGKLSERLAIEGGRTSRSPVVVATLLKAGAPESQASQSRE
jgi:hypothetical protein